MEGPAYERKERSETSSHEGGEEGRDGEGKEDEAEAEAEAEPGE